MVRLVNLLEKCNGLGQPELLCQSLQHQPQNSNLCAATASIEKHAGHLLKDHIHFLSSEQYVDLLRHGAELVLNFV